MNLVEVLVALLVLSIVINFGLDGEATARHAGERARRLQEAALQAQGALDTSIAQLAAGTPLPVTAYVAGPTDDFLTRVDAMQQTLGLWEVKASVYDATGKRQPLVTLQTLQAVRP